MEKRESIIGETRWWSKDAALKIFFGSFNKPGSALYCEVILTLNAIRNLENINYPAGIKAEGFIETLLKYETILTAQIFLRIFEYTTPLSKYLQTSGMDILSANRMVVNTHDILQNLKRDFNGVKDAADTFVKWANDNLHEQLVNSNYHDDQDLEFVHLEVESSLPQSKQRRVRVRDEIPFDPIKDYELKVHDKVMDTVIQSLDHRFIMNGTLYADLALLYPRNFKELIKMAYQIWHSEVKHMFVRI